LGENPLQSKVSILAITKKTGAEWERRAQAWMEGK
jgi:hypothetical protein